MRELTDTERRQLEIEADGHFSELSWQWARRLLDLGPGDAPFSLHDEGTDAELQERHLGRLVALTEMQAVIGRRIDTAVGEAAKYGAGYPALGAAVGMTRQGARRRWPHVENAASSRRRSLAWLAEHHEDVLSAARAIDQVRTRLTEQGWQNWWFFRDYDLRDAVEAPVTRQRAALLSVVESFSSLAFSRDLPAGDEEAAPLRHAAALITDFHAAQTAGEPDDVGPCMDAGCGEIGVVRIRHNGSKWYCHRHAVEVLVNPGTYLFFGGEPGVPLAVWRDVQAATTERLCVVADLYDGGLMHDLERLEELLLQLRAWADEAAAPGGDDWTPPGPLAGTEPIEALNRLQAALRPTQTRYERNWDQSGSTGESVTIPPTGPRWYAADGKYQLAPLSFVALAAADLTTLGAVAAELGRPDGDSDVRTAVGDADDELPPTADARDRERRGIVVTAARIHGMLDLEPTADTALLHDALRAAGDVDELVLTEAQEAAYHRTVDRIAALATLSDPLTRWAMGTRSRT